MCLWSIYIFPESVHIFSCSRIGRPIVGMYKSLTDTWTWKLGLRPRNFFYRNICFEFLVLCLCIAEYWAMGICPLSCFGDKQSETKNLGQLALTLRLLFIDILWMTFSKDELPASRSSLAVAWHTDSRCNPHLAWNTRNLCVIMQIEGGSLGA